MFNVLTLGVVHHGIAFPLVWIMLDKKGNSNTRERCELWNRFLEIFADRQIDFLSADREFVGEEWFDYLRSRCDFFCFSISAQKISYKRQANFKSFS